MKVTCIKIVTIKSKGYLITSKFLMTYFPDILISVLCDAKVSFPLGFRVSG